jgi:hypothetical protein
MPQTVRLPYTVTVKAPALVVSNPTLPEMAVNVPFSHTYLVSGGVPPYTVEVVAGRLPNGLRVDDLSIVGTPLVAGRHDFEIAVSDAS